jgi:flagellar basal-body rod protein FlgC
MNLSDVFSINGSAMKAQMLRMEVIGANVANVNTTRTPEGGPYRRREVIFETTPVVSEDFSATLGRASESVGVGVRVSNVIEDSSPFLLRFEPQHPDAGQDGYVRYPNVNVVAEMVNLVEASRSYDANISVITATKNMIAKTFEIGRS